MSKAEKEDTLLRLSKVIPIYGRDATKEEWNLKNISKKLRVKLEMVNREDLTKEERELMRQDHMAVHFLITSYRRDALAIN